MPEESRKPACAECIALSSDYVDGLLGPVDTVRVDRHVAGCPPCARYLRVLERGLELARDMPTIEASPEFQSRLNRQLREIDYAMSERDRSVRSGAALAVAVAGVVALLAWSPVFRPDTAATFNGTDSASALRTGDAAEGWEWWYNGVEPAAMAPPNANNAFPGPYSPLYVEPPLGGGRARTVLTSLIYTE